MSEVLLQVRTARRGAKAQGARLKRRAVVMLAALKLGDRELSLSVVNDAQIRRLNRDWRGKDQATDVLSFPAGAPLPGTEAPLGDLVISFDTAIRAAKVHGETLNDELDRYLAHGLLHLLGHDHHTPKEARAMERAERRLLGRRGMLADSDEL